MAKFQMPPPFPIHVLLGPSDFWSGGGHGGWATLLVLLFLLLWQLRRLVPRRVVAGGVGATSPLVKAVKSDAGIDNIATNTDLKILLGNLEGKLDENEKWEDVIDKRSNKLSYKAKCCKPKDGPLKYFSVTTFENCSTELLKDFYMDDEYRRKWDKTLVAHEQLQIDEATGTEIGRTIKKFPFLTPREYVLAWQREMRKRSIVFLKNVSHLWLQGKVNLSESDFSDQVGELGEFLVEMPVRSPWCIKKMLA